jgi:hypothetical protein
VPDLVDLGTNPQDKHLRLIRQFVCLAVDHWPIADKQILLAGLYGRGVQVHSCQSGAYTKLRLERHGCKVSG